MLRLFPNTIPNQITVGDTISFTVGLTGYLASDNWSAKLVVASNPPTSFSLTASGGDFVGAIPPEDSRTIKPGQHLLVLVLTHTDGTRLTHSSRITSFLPDPTLPLPASWAGETLGKIEAAITKLSGGTNQSVSVNGENYTKKDIRALMEIRNTLRAEVVAERIALGRGASRKIRTRFRS